MSSDAPEAAPSFPPGSRIGGYVVDGLLGRGGMGEVYRAFDGELERSVAVKLIAAEAARDATFVARFRREAKLAGTVVHPNVAQVYAAGVHEDRPYYVMEYVEGESLAQRLRNHGRLAGSAAVDCLAQACRGLEAARGVGVVHRDIKPSNLILTPDGTLKIVDFGLARSVSVDRHLETEPGLIVGTPTYTAPEQALGLEIDHRADIYSLGATFFHLFSGEAVFAAESALGVLAQHVEAAPRPLLAANPNVPARVAALIDRMLAKEPEDRPQSYGAILEELERAPAHGSTARPAAAKAWYRLPALRGIALLLLAVLLAVRLGDDTSEEPAAAWPTAASDETMRELTELVDAHPLTVMAWRAQALASMRQLSTAVEMHLAEEGVLPHSLETLARDYGLHERTLADPWGQPIVLVTGEETYSLRSFGPDRREGTEDDLVLEDGFFIQGGPEAP